MTGLQISLCFQEKRELRLCFLRRDQEGTTPVKEKLHGVLGKKGHTQLHNNFYTPQPHETAEFLCFQGVMSAKKQYLDLNEPYFIIYCCITYCHSKTQWVKTTANIYHLTQFLWVKNSGTAQPDYSGSRSLMRLQSKYQQLWLQSSEGLTGVRESTSKVAYSQGWRVGAGYWQKASSPEHVDLSAQLLASPRMRHPREQVRDGNVQCAFFFFFFFWTQSQKSYIIISPGFYLSHRQPWYDVGRGYTRA